MVAMRRSKPIRPRLLLLALAATTLLAVLPVRGQEQVDSCLRRTVFASVVDQEGAFIPGLTAGHFRGSFRRKPVKILSARVESKPRRIVVMLDASGSMAQDRSLRWHLARKIASDLISRMPVETPVALVVFAKSILRTVGFDQGREAALRELAALEKHPNLKSPETLTAIYDALLEGAELLGSPEDGDAIYLLTDGWDTASRATPKNAGHAFVAKRARLFGFLLYPVETDPPTVGPDRDRIRELLEFIPRTGGGFVYIRFEYPDGRIRYALEESDRAKLDASLRLMEQRTTDIYRLEIELPGVGDKPREWKLELVPGEGANVKDLRVVYQRKLLPCAKP